MESINRVKDTVRDRDFIVFAMDHYNPLGVVRSLGQAGIRPTVIAEPSRTNISSYSKYTKEYIPVEGEQAGYDLLFTRYGGVLSVLS